MKNSKPFHFFLLILTLVVVLYLADGKTNFYYIKSNLNYLVDLKNNHYILFALSFISLSSILTGLGLPFSTILTIAGGAIFGDLGILFSLFSYSIGTVISVFLANYFLREYLIKKYSNQINSLNSIAVKNPRLLVFSLRLTPLIPFFVANFLLGLVKIPMKIILFFGFLGKFPLTVFYNYIGNHLKKSETPEIFFNFYLFLSLIILAVIPWLIKNKIETIKEIKNL